MNRELRTASLFALSGIPLVKPGNDLGHLIAEWAITCAFQFED